MKPENRPECLDHGRETAGMLFTPAEHAHINEITDCQKMPCWAGCPLLSRPKQVAFWDEVWPDEAGYYPGSVVDPRD